MWVAPYHEQGSELFFLVCECEHLETLLERERQGTRQTLSLQGLQVSRRGVQTPDFYTESDAAFMEYGV